jgi:hypothetical protein
MVESVDNAETQSRITGDLQGTIRIKHLQLTHRNAGNYHTKEERAIQMRQQRKLTLSPVEAMWKLVVDLNVDGRTAVR